jgi:hypothetical protein
MKKSFTIASTALTALTMAAVASPMLASAATDVSSSNTVAFTAGDLGIDFASDISFGTHQIDGSTTTFAGVVAGSSSDTISPAVDTHNVAQNTATSTTNYTTGDPILTWHDLRGANAGAYTITASESTPFGISGAVISFPAGTKTDITGRTPTDVTSITNNAFTLNEDGTSSGPVVNGTGAVSGKYEDDFNTPVQVSIPVAGQSAGVHTATITWTIAAAQ